MKGLLGYVCNECGAHELLKEDIDITDTQKPVTLVFDCIIPQGDKHHKGSTDQRISYYWKQFLLNNVQLLCEPCHGKKSAAEHPQQDIAEFNSFINQEPDPF